MRRAPRDGAARGSGSLLRQWRLARRLSQVALAARAAVSARHLCFLESGRARPSREMVQAKAGSGPDLDVWRTAPARDAARARFLVGAGGWNVNVKA